MRARESRRRARCRDRGRHPQRTSWPPRRQRSSSRTRCSLFVALTWTRDAVLVEAIDQRAARDAELLGGAGLVAGALVERLEDALLLELGDRRAHLGRHVARERARRWRRRRAE